MYGNPTTFGKDFSNYVKNNPVLFWIRLLLASFDGPQFCYQKRLQIPHLLSPEHLGIWWLLYLVPQSQFPPGQWLLSHSLSESCPHLQPSLLLLKFSQFLTVLLESRAAEPRWLLQVCATPAAVQCFSLYCNNSQHKGHQSCAHYLQVRPLRKFCCFWLIMNISSF